MQTNKDKLSFHISVILTFFVFSTTQSPFFLKLQLRIFVRVKEWSDSPGFGAFARFLHFATNATWSILGAARLFFVRVLSDHSINQTINHFI